MTIDESPLESARFGLRIGRWIPANVDELADPGRFDIVIVRRPSSWSTTWVDLTAFDGYVAIHADSLIYWEWKRGGEHPSHSVDTVVVSYDLDLLALMVRDVFTGYRNHYASNPLLDRAAALDGYVEWARSTAADAGFLGVRDGDAWVGFAVIDWSVDPPDVRLAGVASTHQGRGRYRDVVAAMMSATVERSRSGIEISTQLGNVAPQRTWAAMGWRPCRAFETTHLVRASLLSEIMSARPSHDPR